MSDMINHPSHYVDETISVEPIEILWELPFVLANSVKYAFRYQRKGKPVEDLEKAIFYAKTYCECFLFREVSFELTSLEILKYSKNKLVSSLGQKLFEARANFSRIRGEYTDRTSLVSAKELLYKKQYRKWIEELEKEVEKLKKIEAQEC